MYIFQIDRALLQKQVKKVIGYAHGRVLNLGSGSFERYEIPKNVTEYVRMDIAPGMNVDVVGRAENIPFPDEYFDTIISTQVFEHVEHPERAAQEINRILKHKGYVLITVPQWSELHEEPHDYWRYTNFGLKALFERYNFTVTHMEQRGGYFSVLTQMKIRYLIDKFRLHTHPVLGRIYSKLFHMWGLWALWRDKRDTSSANKKHTLGWCAVFQKI